MKPKFIKLSVFCFLAIFAKTVNADSFFDVKSQYCEKILKNQTRSEVRMAAIDYASFSAIKKHFQSMPEYKNIEDYVFNNISYYISDNLLRDVSVLTIEENDEKVCIELTGKVRTEEFEALIKKQNFKNIDKDKAINITNRVKEIYPASSQPQIFIEKLTFYNGISTDKYIKFISDYLSFNPNIVIVTDKNTADYTLKASLIKSAVDIIDDKNSKYSMSVKLDLIDNNNKIAMSQNKNRYIIIENKNNKQEIADKLLKKLLKEAIDTMQKEGIIFN